jgi:hypothetical protein
MGGRSKPKDKKESSSPAPVDNSAQVKQMQDQMKQQNAKYEKEKKDATAAEKLKSEESIAKAKEFAMQQDAAKQSANARSLATENQQDVSNKLQSTLSAPIQTGTMNYGAQASGYNPAAAKQAQAATMGSAGAPAPMASPSAAIAAKINADAGGTNAVQNRYTMPNTQGLQFGGT